jgi:GTP diphosphokinase / guanosine-3',5'-bis(diphosphate) 3'-diphosphatase
MSPRMHDGLQGAATGAALQAMAFALRVHAAQTRDDRRTPYASHLSEVAGVAACMAWAQADVDADTMLATAWLHDCIESQHIAPQVLHEQFGPQVAAAVLLLSDTEVGSPEQRRDAKRARLADAPAWIQSIKCADLISNCRFIALHDPAQASAYLAEAREILSRLTRAHPQLHALAVQHAQGD